MSKEIKKLDAELGSRLRNSQVVTKVSDIVRELVDNSIDADAHSVQVFLDDFGLKKIEVKDTGHGIPADSIQSIMSGGHTSKLPNVSHLSCDQQYGFRGEALAAICAFSNVIVTTKTEKDECAQKFAFDNEGKILSQTKVALGTGTVIVVGNLFEKFPVRRNFIRQKNVCQSELKEIESYIKALGISNHHIYLSLYHNGSLIWSKPSVRSVEHGLTSVLGVNLAKNLSKRQSVTLNYESNSQPLWTGKLDIFVPSPPVDLSTMAFTNNKMLMIFVNRRRVFLKEYEKIVKLYVIAASESPTQAEQRKYPLAVVIIEVPPSEVDFNRDMDKSKIFLTCQEFVGTKLKELLQSFYGIDWSVISADKTIPAKESDNLETEVNPSSSNVVENEVNAKSPTVNPEKDTANAESEAISKTMTPPATPKFIQIIKPVPSTPEKRRENILTFLENLPAAPKLQSDDRATKGITEKSLPPKSSVTTNNEKDCTDKSTPSTSAGTKYPTPPEKSKESPAAKFDISFEDIWDLDLGEEPSLPSSTNTSTAVALTNISSTCNNSAPQTTPVGGKNIINPLDKVTPPNVIFLNNGFKKPPSVLNKSFPGIGSQLTRPFFQTYTPPPTKKLKLFETPVEVFSRETILTSELKKPRQITLEQLKNWPATPKVPKELINRPNPKLILKQTRTMNLSKPLSLEDIDDVSSLMPHTMKYLEEKSISKPTSSESNDNTDDIKLHHKSLVGLVAKMSLRSALETSKNNKLARTTMEENNSPKVISHFSGTNYHVVKIDGLLGCFNPNKVLEIRPHLRYQLPKELQGQDSLDSTFSNESVVFLLEEFTKFAEILDMETTTMIFQVLADLQG